jgi:hypothetical protein
VKSIFNILVLLSVLVACAPLGATTSPITNTPTYLPPSTPPAKKIPTPTPSATITATSIPTLSVDDARARLLELLATNGNCHLPCLWGITPGKSTFDDAREILTPLSSLSSTIFLNSSSSGGISSSYIENNIEIYSSMSFLTYPESEIVNSISFHLFSLKRTGEGFEHVFDTSLFRERASAYMLPHLLSELGIPASILIQTLAGLPSRDGVEGFYLILLYPDQGVLIYYTMGWESSAGYARGCLDNLRRLEMNLYPSGHGDLFSEFLAQTQWASLWPMPVNIPNWKSIDEASSMSINEFYEVFREPTDQCIATPISLWPVPEP